MANLQVGDIVVAICYKSESRQGKEPEWSNWYPLKSNRGYDEWGATFLATQLDLPREIEVKVKRGENELDNPLPLKFTTDTDWPLEERGFLFVPDTRRQQASSVLQAIGFGVEETWNTIGKIYMNLKSLG